jgi:hypothetical protein
MPQNVQPPRPRRADCFLGIHFDFHARNYCRNIGARTTREMVEAFLDRVRPDYVQIDCKGTRGICSYPTKAGYTAPGVVADQLRVWRNVTAERGVTLILHYCGLWDTKNATVHPDWARLDENGKPDGDVVSFFSPYVDKLMLPQFKELSDVYQVDGVWVDADCWAARPDYRPDVVEQFQQRMGIEDIPKKPGDPHFYEWMQFMRQAYRRYLTHYVDEMHKYNPKFSICCNWAFSSHMPGKPDIGVDYLSGDYKWYDSVNSARFEGRCLQNQGKSWDLMAWSFNGTLDDECFSTKTVPQLQREAAVVLALGGGFQYYFRQNQDASIMMWQLELMGEVAKFCRPRQAFCHHAEPVPQIALLFSDSGYLRIARGINPSWNEDLEPMAGVLNALLDAQNHVEVILDHHVLAGIDKYPLVVVPEWEHIDPAVIDKLIAYARNGGKLLIIGPKAAAQFGKLLDVEYVGEAEHKKQWLEQGRWLGVLQTLKQRITPGQTAAPFGRLFNWEDYEETFDIPATITPCGKGAIAAMYLNFGRCYYNAATVVSRDFLTALVRQLFPDPMVSVTGSHYVDVTVNRIGGKLAINLVNTAGPHHSPTTWTFDEIPTVGPLTITIRSDHKPKSITLQPENRPLAFDYAGGKATLTLDKLAIHNIILIDE